MRRRDALKLGLGAGASAAVGLTGMSGFAADSSTRVSQLRIAAVNIELAPGVGVPGIAFDGPVDGTPSDIHNATDDAQVMQSPLFAGSLLKIAPRAGARIPLRSSTGAAAQVGAKHYRAYCTASHSIATGSIDVARCLARDAGAYDQRHSLLLHRWLPQPVTRSAPFSDTVTAYRFASFNHRLLTASEPIQVRYGERVWFHISNECSTLPASLALPQHRFLIMALDGNAVPTPCEVEHLFLGPGESIDAVVNMNQPGRWVLGSTRRDDRAGGLGRIIEYAGAHGAAVVGEFGFAPWDYTLFGALGATDDAEARGPAASGLLSLQTLQAMPPGIPSLVDPSPQTAAPLTVVPGVRYRVAMTNFTRDAQSVQLLGHEVHLVNVAGQRTAGIVKDVITLPSYTRIECEFIARSRAVTVAHPRQVTLETVLKT